MKKAFILLLGFVVCVNTQAMAQSSSFLGFDRAAETEAIVSDIAVEGTQRIDPATVISYMQIRPGDSYTQASLSNALKRLYATGLFADVKIRQQGNALTVTVVENPVINRVVFEGNESIEDSELVGEVSAEPRSVYVRGDVRNDVTRLQELYRRSGNYSVTVTPKVIKLDQNRINLVYQIDEGPESTIKGINFIGNEDFEDSELRSVISSKEDRWYRFLSSDDKYDPDRMAFDQELLRRFYLQNGYVDFKMISSNAELSQDKESFFLTYTLQEGDRYKVNNVSIDTSRLRNIDNVDLVDAITVDEGEWYSSEELENTIQGLTDRLGDMQYAFARIRPDIQRNPNNNTLDIVFRAEETQRVFVEEINIKGNVRTLDKVIRREFDIVEGDPFSASEIAEAEKNIQNLDFFKKVAVKPKPGSAPDQTVIEVDVEEKSTGEISVGAGFSTSDGPLADLRIRERNFLGKGQDVLFATTVAGERTEFDLSFTEPYFFNRDLAAGIDLFHITQDLQSESSYDQRTTGGALRLTYPLSEKLRQKLQYRYQTNEIENVDAGASRFIRDQEGQRDTSAISQSLTYNDLNSNIVPTDGYRLWLDTEIAGLGGDAEFISVKTGGNYYYPVTKKITFNTLAEIGLIEGYNNSDVQINERYFLGSRSFRGFEYGGIGPRDLNSDDSLGGNYFYRGSSELSFPVGLPEEMGIKGHFFTDYGSLWGVDESGSEVVDENSLRASVGVGVSWVSPLGPLRVDLASPVLDEEYDKDEIFRFDFGTRF